MADLHFLRPLWLLALPIGAWLLWQLLRGRGETGGWRNVVEARLRRYVLIEPEVLRDSRLALIVALAAWFVAVVAMAGPAWERLPVPAFRSDEALVVALDLSRSMDAGDVEPSRLARAKLKLLDLLERRAAGQTALVVFTTHAFTVTPLTTDTRTISSLVGAISTDIMPTRGGSLAAGLEKARALLRQTGVHIGDVLLITDSEVADADVSLARDLAGQGYRTSVLAVGTEQGAPIPQAEGGFVTDGNGQVVIPQVDMGALRRLADAGRGRFARLAPDDRDLEALFPPATGGPLDVAIAGDEAQKHEVDVWRDRGAWLALAVLPMLALLFRRGWVCVWLLVLLVPVPRAQAFEWSDLWLRRDQRGLQAMQEQQPARAATLFQNPEWRGAAQFRSGEFDASAATLAAVDSADAHYNRGNALAKAGKVEAAIEAYDRALALDPSHEDARFNRDLLKKFLEDHPQQQQQQQQAQQQQQDQKGNQDHQGKQGDSKDASGDDEQANGQKSGREKGKPGDSGKTGASDAQGDSEEQKQKDGEQQQDATNATEQQNGQDSPNKAPGPEDVDKWASEQAAEQWLRRVPQDPGGLLRRKFLYQYQRMGVDQDGKPVLQNGPERKPW